MEHELTPTLEDYLQAIYNIERRQKVARSRDISEAQNVASSTVTAALQSLADRGMINYEPYELITLTDEGRKRAEQLALRHLVVRNFVQEVLGLEARRAETTTCEMEHTINREALERFVCFLAFIQGHSPKGVSWLEAFRRFIERGADGHSCEQCVKAYMDRLRMQDEH